MIGAAMGRPGAASVERAGRAVLDAGLRGGSAFTPGSEVWTSENADVLDRFYVQRPDAGSGRFIEKLQIQLEDAPPAAIQLCAELLYLNVLPLANVSAATKRARIDNVLSWMPAPVDLPDEFATALEGKIFNGGVGFNTMLWTQLTHLVRFVQAWWAADQTTREQALVDPWAWSHFVDSVGGSPAEGQRHELKYLAFPATFLPIVSKPDRKAIRKAYTDLLPVPPGDLDRDLLEIFHRLRAESSGQKVDFYLEPWVDRWKPALTASRHAWLVRPPTGQMDQPRQWLENGTVTLTVPKLRELPRGSTLDAVREAVGLDYSSVDYVRQEDLAQAVHAFLTLMSDGDVVATTSGESLVLGTVTQDAPVFRTDRLRWAVSWRTAELPRVPDLPAPLPTHLATPGTVVDLSEDVDRLLELLTEEGTGDIVTAGGFIADEVPVLRPVTAELARQLHFDVQYLQEWVDLLSDRQQVIFYGPPGTGKTYVAEKLARFLADAGGLESDRVALVQFHPSTSYEDFVEGYRPSEGDTEGQISFRLTPGPLSRIVAAARDDPGRPYFLLIDEINRANLAKVFGELYYLLEYRNSGIQLLYRPGKPFTMPNNVFVIGTMNTADRSIALVDAAMRRRFAFIELHPDDEPVKGMLRRWLVAGKKPTERADLLTALNDRLDERDFKIGPSYLMKADADRDGGLARVWRYSILPLLVEHHYGQRTPKQIESEYGLAALRKDLSVPDNSA